MACFTVTTVLLLLHTACGCLLEHLENSSHFVGRCGSSALKTKGTNKLAQQMGDLVGATSLFLDLQHNLLKDDGASELAAGFHHLTNLSSLTLLLDGNELGDAAIVALAAGLEKLVRLEGLVLSLQYNNIHSLGAGMLGSAMAKMQKLRNLSLQLKFNSIASSGTGDLVGGLSKIPKLQSLALGLFSNAIGDAGAADLGLGLVQMRHLRNLTVDLRYNHVEGGACDLRTSLKQLTNVTAFVMPPELMLAVTTTDTTSKTPALRGTSSIVSTTVRNVMFSSTLATTVTSTALALGQVRVTREPGKHGKVAPSARVHMPQRSVNHKLASEEVMPAGHSTGQMIMPTTSIPTPAREKPAAYEDSRRPAVHDDADIATLTSQKPVSVVPEETGLTGITLLAMFLVAVAVITGVACSWARLRSSAREYSNSLPQTTAPSSTAPSTQDDFNPNDLSQAPADDFDPNLPQAPKTSQSEQTPSVAKASQPARPLLANCSPSNAASPAAIDDFNPNEPMQPLQQSASPSRMTASSPKESLDSLITQSLSRI